MIQDYLFIINSMGEQWWLALLTMTLQELYSHNISQNNWKNIKINFKMGKIS